MNVFACKAHVDRFLLQNQYLIYYYIFISPYAAEELGNLHVKLMLSFS